MSDKDKKEVVIADFSKRLNKPELGKIVCSELEIVFDEEDFLAYAAAAEREIAPSEVN